MIRAWRMRNQTKHQREAVINEKNKILLMLAACLLLLSIVVHAEKAENDASSFYIWTKSPAWRAKLPFSWLERKIAANA